MELALEAIAGEVLLGGVVCAVVAGVPHAFELGFQPEAVPGHPSKFGEVCKLSQIVEGGPKQRTESRCTDIGCRISAATSASVSLAAFRTLVSMAEQAGSHARL